MAVSKRKDALIAVVGATGTGKSQLAIALARAHNGEVINGDAMQLYEGLPIITNKVTVTERQGVPHHLLGCISLGEPTWVVGTFAQKAREVIEDVRARGKVPILVGGTHYYLQSLLFRDRLADAAEGEGEADADVKAHVEDMSERWPILRESTEALMTELRKVDPVMADRWHPNDRRKIQRSLEIYLQTGRRASDIYAEQRQRKNEAGRDIEDGNGTRLGDPLLRSPTLLFWVHASKDVLDDRLNGRVEQMLERGLLDEVRTLDSLRLAELNDGRTVDESRGIWVSIGYKEFKQYSQAVAEDSGTISPEREKLKAEAIEKTKIATRQYAKRQVRWIRIKLINALAEAHASRSMYVLDGSDVSQFAARVVAPAIDITESFLTASPLPDPGTVSDCAAELLVPKRDYDLSAAPEQWVRSHCEVCGVTCVTESQWEMHVKSKAHRKLVSKQKKTQDRPRAVSVEIFDSTNHAA